MVRMTFLAMGMLVAWGCTNPRVEPNSRERVQQAQSSSTRVAKPLLTEDDRKLFVVNNNQFAFDLYQWLNADQVKGNLFFSPASISMALALTYAGARGETADQIGQVMHFSLGPQKLHEAFAAYIADLNDNGSAANGHELSIANALWAAKGCSWRDYFLKVTSGKYRAAANDLNFADFDSARGTINAWVAKETHQRIAEIVPQGSLGPQTRLVLTNAVYFKGQWAEKFDKRNTVNDKFTLQDGKQVWAAMMNTTGKYRYLENDALQMLELPYQGNAVSMIVLLPRGTTHLRDLEANLSAKKLDQYLGSLQVVNGIEVALPRFKAQFDLKLAQTLPRMGMTLAFGPGRADFSGMIDGDRLFLQDVFHKAHVEVDEEGTEATATTAVTAVALSAPSPLMPPKFRADHPFLFVLRDNRNGSILFIGRLADPTALH